VRESGGRVSFKARRALFFSAMRGLRFPGKGSRKAPAMRGGRRNSISHAAASLRSGNWC